MNRTHRPRIADATYCLYKLLPSTSNYFRDFARKKILNVLYSLQQKLNFTDKIDVLSAQHNKKSSVNNFQIF